jgi:hypothetical protein
VKLVYRVQPLHHPRTNTKQVAQVTLWQMMVTALYLECSHDINKCLHAKLCTPTQYKTILRYSQCSGQETPTSYRTQWLIDMFIRSTTPGISPFNHKWYTKWKTQLVFHHVLGIMSCVAPRGQRNGYPRPLISVF